MAFISDVQKKAFEAACLGGDWKAVDLIITSITSFPEVQQNFDALKELLPNGGADIGWRMKHNKSPLVVSEIIIEAEKKIGKDKTLALLKNGIKEGAESYPLLYWVLCGSQPAEEEREILPNTLFGNFADFFLSPDLRGIGFKLMALSPDSMKKFFHTMSYERKGSIQQGMLAAGPAVFEALNPENAVGKIADIRKIADIICDYALQEGGPGLLKRVLVGSEDPDKFDLNPAFRGYESVKIWADKVYTAGGQDLVIECLRSRKYELWTLDLERSSKNTVIREWFEVAMTAGGQQLVGELIEAAAQVDRPISMDIQKLIVSQAQRYGDVGCLEKKWWPSAKKTGTPQP